MAAPLRGLDNEDLTRRAIAAFYRYGGGNPGPNPADSGLEAHEGLAYVVLRNATKMIGVYRVLPGGALKRLTMKRLPATLKKERENTLS